MCVGRRCGWMWMAAGVGGEWVSADEEVMWLIVDVGGAWVTAGVGECR